MKMSYLVSTYNAGSFLNEHLNKILNYQTDSDFEVIVVNPNSPSTDEAVAIKWAERDCRVNYIYHPEREPYGRSWLRAWKAATGELVCNSNTDDFHHITFTEMFYKTAKSALAHEKFFYSGLHVLNEHNQVIGGGIKPPFDYETYSRECWGGPQLCWDNSEQFRDSLDWNLMEERSYEHTSAFDYWLMLYFMSLGYHGKSIPQQLTYYVQRSSSIENSNTGLNNYETYASISEFFPSHFQEGGKLHQEASEFADFNNLPNKQEWINKRNARS